MEEQKNLSKEKFGFALMSSEEQRKQERGLCVWSL